jgi:hypothetical protein
MELKSVSSLRSAGETRRFTDELDYLLSGLDSSRPLAIRQTACLETVLKMCPTLSVFADEDEDEASHEDDEMETGAPPDLADEISKAEALEFLRGLRLTDRSQNILSALIACGCGAQFYEEAFDSSGLLDSILALYFARLLSPEVGFGEDLLRENEDIVVLLLSSMITRCKSNALSLPVQRADARRSNKSNKRLEQPTQAIFNAVRSCGILAAKKDDSLSTTNLLLYALEHFLPILSPVAISSLIREDEEAPSSQARTSTPLLDHLVDMCLDAEKNRSDPASTKTLLQVKTCIASLLSRSDEIDEELATIARSKVQPALTALRRSLVNMGRKVDLALLRLLILATQDCPENCELIASSDVCIEQLLALAVPTAALPQTPRKKKSSEADEVAPAQIEHQCVLLGLLTNILEHCPSKRSHVAQMKPNSSKDTAVTIISTAFCRAMSSATETEEPALGVLSGCLAVVVGLLIEGNHEATADYRVACESADQISDPVERLALVLDEFANANEQVRRCDGDEEDAGESEIEGQAGDMIRNLARLIRER